MSPGMFFKRFTDEQFWNIRMCNDVSHYILKKLNRLKLLSNTNMKEIKLQVESFEY